MYCLQWHHQHLISPKVALSIIVSSSQVFRIERIINWWEHIFLLYTKLFDFKSKTTFESHLLLVLSLPQEVFFGYSSFFLSSHQKPTFPKWFQFDQECTYIYEWVPESAPWVNKSPFKLPFILLACPLAVNVAFSLLWSFVVICFFLTLISAPQVIPVTSKAEFDLLKSRIANTKAEIRREGGSGFHSPDSSPSSKVNHGAQNNHGSLDNVSPMSPVLCGVLRVSRNAASQAGDWERSGKSEISPLPPKSPHQVASLAGSFLWLVFFFCNLFLWFHCLYMTPQSPQISG